MATFYAITTSEFSAKWQGSTRTERAASQEHFIDLCRMLGEALENPPCLVVCDLDRFAACRGRAPSGAVCG